MALPGVTVPLSVIDTTVWACFFLNDTATTEIYTLSLHDALPIYRPRCRVRSRSRLAVCRPTAPSPSHRDRKSTRLNSSHRNISYAVFCFKKKIRQILLYEAISIFVLLYFVLSVCPLR